MVLRTSGTLDRVRRMTISAGDPRRHAPATLRNREPIIRMLERALPRAGLALEIASGTGEHAVAFAEALPHLTWQPTDRDSAALASIGAHAEAAGLTNLRPPLLLDCESAVWPIARADAIICINMIHIAPWSACVGLLAGAARLLNSEGALYLYGPFRQGGEHTADSNRRFDADLRSRDPNWGVRDLGEVSALAATHGLALVETVSMPANNLGVLFRCAAASLRKIR
jgi:hypothetical protein